MHTNVLLYRLPLTELHLRFHISGLVAYCIWVHKYLKKVIRNLHNLTVRNACKGKSTNLIERLGEVPCAVLRAMF